MPKSAYCLPQRWVVTVGVILFAIATALPWAWLVKNGAPALAPSPRRLALRPALRILPPGKFAMGSPAEESGRFFDEDLHTVEITVPFALSLTEVTQRQYQNVMGENPSTFKGQLERPVDNVSWLDAVAYCNKLSRLERLPECYEIRWEKVQWRQGLRCTGYRLPTEAEWEYAARADGETLYSGSNDAKEVAWFAANAASKTNEVGQKRPNGWGLYDMSGNVGEWVWDHWEESLGSQATKDPIGNGDRSYRVFRGGSWVDQAKDVRVAYRASNLPTYRGAYQGFRIARSYP